MNRTLRPPRNVLVPIERHARQNSRFEDLVELLARRIQVGAYSAAEIQAALPLAEARARRRRAVEQILQEVRDNDSSRNSNSGAG